MTNYIRLLCTTAAVLATGITTAQDVNPFTGDFSYSLPLLTVPSPDGPGVPVSIHYGAGIGVNQPASEAGLGWSISAGGAISRLVSGIPDDWQNKSVPSVKHKEFKDMWGVLSFHNSPVSGDPPVDLPNDFYTSTFKLDTPKFYYPDYDAWYVSGPSIGGRIEPHFFDFNTITLMGDNLDDFWPAFTNKGQFHFVNDFADTVNARHYAWSILPLDQNDSVYIPGTSIGGSTTAFNGNAIDTSRSRLFAAYFVEYFTNQDIDNNYDVNGDTIYNFIDFEVVTGASDRSSATKYDPTGIGAFRITDPNGFTYHYSLPVYSNSTLSGTYPLNNDYSIPDFSLTETFSGSSFFTTDANHGGSVVEHKQVAKIADNWLLTAVTGPDYEDSNANNIVDDGDKGYWVGYDWKKWTDSFLRRNPDYGFNYAFTATADESTENDTVKTAAKINGRRATFGATDREIYYLNRILTATHSAVFVRELRLDGHSSPNHYDDTAFIAEVRIDNIKTPNSWGGYLYDDGGPSGNYTYTSDHNIVIAPAGADKVNILFESFTLGFGDTLYLYDGPSTSSPLIVKFWNTSPPLGKVTSLNDTITVRLGAFTNSAAGFKMWWEAGWDNDYPQVTPQLKVSKIVLLENDSLNNIAAPVRFSSSSAGYKDRWDLDNTTTATDSAIYHTDWYTTHKTAIERASLRTIEFNHDYSLAQKYYNNINVVLDTTTFKDTPPDVVADSIKIVAGIADSMTGKLTLKEIITYEKDYTQIVPSYVLDYASNTSNNPDYNPIEVDYWGYRKYDVSSKAYSSYTTSSSKDSTDAWSLRKITLPAGGTVEVQYESDDYLYVLKDTLDGGGFRGASRTFLIEDADAIAGEMGEDFKVTFEDELDEMWSLVSSPPAGTVRNVCIPFTSRANGQCYNNTEWYISHGAATSIVNNTNDTVKGLSCYRWTDVPAGQELDGAGEPNGYFESSCVANDLEYTGNGYINFQLAAGQKVFGGGLRVNKLTYRNGSSDSLVTRYSYSGGVTPIEPDRFIRPKKEKDIAAYWHFNKAKGFDLDPHALPSMVGYTKVTVENLGQVDSANASVTYTFHTSDEGIENFDPIVISDTVEQTADPCGLTTDEINYAINVSDKFSGYWGKVRQIETRDANGNMISRTQNDYTSLARGALTEVYNFRNTESWTGTCSPGPCTPPSCQNDNDVVCIKRRYPCVLTRQTSYAGGFESVTEYEDWDPITGAVTKAKATDPVAGEAITASTAAYHISQYARMGSKVTDSTYANVLLPVAESKTLRDTAITGQEDFLSHSVTTFSDTLTVRRYNATGNKFENDTDTAHYWRAIRNYAWAGPLSKYGLYDADSLAAFSHSVAASNSAHWRFSGQVTLIDERGHVLENKGFNDRFSATRYCHGDKFPLAQGAGANFVSFTHCSFEDSATVEASVHYFDGEVKLPSGYVHTGSDGTRSAHTGDFYLKIPQNNQEALFTMAFDSAQNAAGNLSANMLRGVTYKATVWVHEDSPASAELILKLDGENETSQADISLTASMQKSSAGAVQVGEWIRLSVELTVPETYQSDGGPAGNNDLRLILKNPSGSGGDAYFDDLRVQPVTAGVTANVYDPATGRVTATLSNDNFFVKYEYDQAGRLVRQWAETVSGGVVKVLEKKYGFARQ